MNRLSRHFWIVLGICALCTGAALWLFSVDFKPLVDAEFYSQDLLARLGRKTAYDPRLVLIGVDRASYASYFSEQEMQRTPELRAISEPYPWSRDVWAALIAKLADAGAKAIVIDLVFAAPKNGDDALARALDKYRDRVVIGYALDQTETDQKKFVSLTLPSETVIAPPEGRAIVEDDRLGFVTIWPDEDDILRRAHFRHTGDELQNVLPPEVKVESLAARALRKFGCADLIPPGTEPRRFRYTAPGGTYKPILIGDVLLPKTWEHNYGNGAFFKDKLVLIGPTATVMQDKHSTPLGEMPGPEIHLNIINAALHGEFLRNTSVRATLLVIAIAGLLAAALCFLFREPVKRLLVVFALGAGWWFLAKYLFEHAGIFIPTAAPLLILPVAAPLTVLFIGSAVVLSFDFLLERLDKARVRKTLERYVSKNVVKELLDNPQTFFNSLTGVRKPVTILFSDVRGFTTLTESADSAALVKQLNEYFEEMVRLVFAHHGSLDKFIGDAVMAVWGNIVSESPAADAKRAVATALAMRQSLARLNEDWKKRGMLDLHIGIGVNHGEVIVGNLGSTEKMELTVIGDAVNLASRLEGLTKKYHLDLLLGESVAKLVGDTYLLRTVASVQVKGKTQPVDVYTVAGEGAGQTVSLPLWLARYEEGVRQYRDHNFAKAADLFRESLRQKPDDFLSARYLEFSEKLIKNPPDESWTYAEVMTDK
ncbi:MAG: adenylate/guanylate cyclase domain-containing protein [Verrucomicrobia bacterium]|nr:adenylate/guanylate cyclase domain-containing protein [Verrucomicrobiota bacterium]